MDKNEIASSIIGKLLNIGGILQKEGNRLLMRFDLNQQQFSVFFEIAKMGRVRQKDMVNRLMLERAHVSKIVKKLQKMGLITVSETDDDKRSSWLSTTDKGDSVLGQCVEMFTEWNSQWFKSLTEDQLLELLGSIQLLQNNFKNNIT